MSKRTLAYLLGLTLSGACATQQQNASLAEEQPEEASESLTLNTAYNVQASLASTRCLAAASASGANGSGLTLADCSAAPGLQWVRTGVNSALVTLGSKCLDVVDGNKNNGAKLQLWDCAKDNGNQRWSFKNGQLQWIGTGKCLDLVDGQFKDGAAVQLWDCNDENKNQKWRFAQPAERSTGIDVGAVLAATDANFSGASSFAATNPNPGRFTGQNVVSAAYPETCLDVHDVQTTPFVQLYACNNSTPQRLTFNDRNQITFPFRNIANGNAIIAANSYCLGADAAETSGDTIAVLVPCDPASTQQAWRLQGNTIRHIASDKCLSTGPWGNVAGRVPMVDCNGSPSQNWSTGKAEAIIAPFRATLAGRDVASMSQPAIAIIDRSSNSAGMKRMVELYQTSTGLLTWIQQAIAQNNQIAYLSGAQMPYVQSLKIIFEPFDGAAYVVGGNNAELHVSSKWAASFNPTDAPLKFKVDAMFHHELTHVFQNGYGLPGGLVEGFANYIAYRAGFIGEYEKKKGGSWQDGYSTTSFFLTWLDGVYLSSTDPQLFGARMNTAAQKAQRSETADWLPAWFQQQTGKTIDALWADYQKTF